MRFIFKIHIGKIKSTYLIDAKNEDEAKDRLLLRLPPDKRGLIKIDSITIDPKSIMAQEPYGIFGDE